MTACGYTPDQISAMEAYVVFDLFRYWSDHPPVHEILAAVHGIKPKEKEKTKEEIAAEMPEWLRAEYEAINAENEAFLHGR